jgi:hypothetical protein
VRRVWLQRLFTIAFSLLPGVVVAAPLYIGAYDADSREPLDGVNLALPDSAWIKVTDKRGSARLELLPGRYRVHASHVGYREAHKEVELGASGAAIRIYLFPRTWEVDGAVTTGVRLVEAPGAMALSPVEVHRAPGPTPDPVRFVKVLPGVTSGNDFSNAYGVQGGSYAENLVYVNGVEIEAPLQLRRGLAETFTVVNPAMIGQVNFRAGSFPVHYGDRLSSVLDVDYRLPEQRLEGRVEASLLLQSLTLGGQLGGNLRVLVGGRRADLGRLTRRLQTEDEYRPSFSDLQALIEWSTSKTDRVIAFAAQTSSRFRVAPTHQVLRYNCSDVGCDTFSSAIDGGERYDHDTHLLGLRWERQAAARTLSVFAHLLRQEEYEDTDLAYRTRWQPLDRGAGYQQEQLFLAQRFHSRLELWRWEAGLQHQRGPHGWGVGVRLADLQATTSGYEGLSSADDLDGAQDATTTLERSDPDLYAYGQRQWGWGGGELTGGLRLVRFGSTEEVLALPRLSVMRALGERWELLLAAGLHAQPPLYREFLGAEGSLRSQKSAQLTAGVAWRARSTLHGRAELFYRRLTDLMSYQLDDMRLVYAGDNDARGYAYGANTHLRGELARLVGIVSYSYLMAREDLAGDGRGYMPRPGDQRHTTSVYVEDHMDLRPLSWLLDSTFHIRVLYGSGFPYTPRLSPGEPPATGDMEPGMPLLVDGERNSRRDLGYFRFDVGMVQTVALWGVAVDVREEVANFFDQYNVVSHTYLPTPDGAPVELRTALGRRTLNLAVSTRFGGR